MNKNMNKRKLKICYMGDAASPHIAFWAQSFARLGHEVHVISPNNAEINGIKVHPTKTGHHKAINFFLTYLTIRRLIKKINPDLIHAHYLGTFSFLGALTGFHPFIGTVWGSDIDVFGEKNYFTESMLKYILKKSDLIEVADKTTKHFLIDKYKINNKKIDFPYWGINTEDFRPKKYKKSIDVLYLRKSSNKYAADVLVEAISLVEKKFPKVKFTLIRDPNHLKVEDLIKKHNLEKNIKNLRWVSHKEIPFMLNSSLIYVDSFHRNTPGGGMGITAMEAMSCELPVVLADNPGVSDYIKHGYNGLIYKGGDYKELAECMIKLLESKKLREKLGKNARKTMIDELDWNKISQKIEKKYFELVNPS